MPMCHGIYISSEIAVAVAANTQLMAGIITVVWTSSHSGPTTTEHISTLSEKQALTAKLVLPSMESSPGIGCLSMMPAFYKTPIKGGTNLH